MNKKNGFDKSIIILILLFLIAVATVIVLYFKVRTDKYSELIHKGETVEIIFFVTQDEKLLFSEVFAYNPNTSKGAIFDIPGEIGSIIEKYDRTDRIDVLYSQGEPESYIDKVGQLLNTSIDFYFEITLENLGVFVDLIDGLKIFVSNEVNYTDPETGERILLPSGSYLLDGDKLQSFLTYRLPGEDEGEQIRRYWKFQQAFLQRIGEKADFLVTPEVLSIIRPLVKTSLRADAFESWIQEMRKFSADRLIKQRSRGKYRTIEIDDLEKTVLFLLEDGKILKDTFRQSLESLANQDIISDEALNIRVSIMNGTAVNGLAGRTKTLFAERGYDVISIGNAYDTSVEESFIVYQPDSREKADRMSAVINCHELIPISEAPAAYMQYFEKNSIDLLLILGKDFNGQQVR